MSDKPLPCPFCGNEPERNAFFGKRAARCFSVGCPAAGSSHLIDDWNTRAPAAEPAVGGVAHQRVTVAIEGVGKMVPANADSAWLQDCAIHNLRQALAALRPPAAPVSVAFWLGREA